jgi:hypothetical protein
VDFERGGGATVSVLGNFFRETRITFVSRLAVQSLRLLWSSAYLGLVASTHGVCTLAFGLASRFSALLSVAAAEEGKHSCASYI